MHILLADDDNEDLEILKEAVALTGHNIQLSYVPNWMELWISLMKELPDILLLDINMPVKNGLECLDSIRSEEKFKQLPVIMYSVSANKKDIDRAYELGANYYLVKPTSTEGLTHIMQKIFQMNGQLDNIPQRNEFIIV